jgi:hypothetical protein
MSVVCLEGPTLAQMQAPTVVVTTRTHDVERPVGAALFCECLNGHTA